MPLRIGRPLVVAMIVVLAVSTALAAGGVSTPAKPIGASASIQAGQAGISGDVAARLLNAEAAKQKQHAGMTHVLFILNWLPNVEFAGLWMAQKFGWWYNNNIVMTYKGWTPAVHPETDVPTKGGTTFGFQSGAAIVIARSQGVPIKALYTDTQKSVFGLTVLASSKIQNLRQLAGKRIGYQSHEFYVPATMMACVGLTQNQWRPVQVGFDIVQLTAHHVDAYLTFVTNEPIALQMNGVASRTFLASKYCFHFYDDVMFTYDKLISQNPALVRKVTGIVARGFQYAHSHPVVSAQYTTKIFFPASVAGKDAFGHNLNANTNLDQQIRELRAFTPFSRTPDGRFDGTMNAKTWQDSIDVLYRYGQIKSKPPVSSLFTNQFNPY